jgi:Curli production assembly/transport component CsgG
VISLFPCVNPFTKFLDMKTSLILLTCSALLTFSFSRAAEKPLSIAVLDLSAPKGLEAEAEKLTLLLGVHLSQKAEFQMVERVEIEKLLSEQELSLTGTIDTATASKIGHIVGAQILITGRVLDVGGKHMAVAKIIGVETSRVSSVSTEFTSLEEVTTAAEKMTELLTQRLKDPQSAFTTKEESWDEMIARLKKALPAGVPLPSVRVAIPEEHISRRVPDPAAQTEIQKVLQELGFKIVDGGPADFSIEGEAFSERASQRGQMIFCKARLEVKVADAKKEKIWVDRQTTSAVDLAENVAGKTALQKAGRSIADRVVTDFFSRKLPH